MADNASSPSPSGFNKLPVELLKRIVELVRDQDTAFVSCRVKRADPYGVDEDDLTSQVAKEDVASGTWSAAYGQGIRALSVVSKTLRTLTLPMLFETVQASQLEEAFFRDNVLSEPICQLIKHVLLFGLGEEEVGQTAWAFPLLSSVTTLSIDGEEARILSVPKSPLETLIERETMRRHLHRLLPRLAAVRLRYIDVHDLVTILTSPAFPSHLRRLELADLTSDSSALTDEPVCEAFNARGLEELVVGSALLPFYPPVARSGIIPVPSLTLIEIPAQLQGADTLLFIERLAPNLRSLSLSDVDDALNMTGPFSFPHLVHLHLIGRRVSLDLLPRLALSPIRTLVVKFTRRQSDSSLERIGPAFDDWPQTLRLLHVELQEVTVPAGLASLSSSLAARGVIVETRCTLRDSTKPTATAEGERLLQRQQAVQDDFRWGVSEAERLGRAGDVRGMEELAAAAHRLRQKRVLAMQ
ncbi:hypothetical protein JCM6882_004858 [Rhodosporidiobolus microsporus]